MRKNAASTTHILSCLLSLLFLFHCFQINLGIGQFERNFPMGLKWILQTPKTQSNGLSTALSDKY
ncbi:uncharacterized protein DS421_19g671310 [Arachis hypogaea]|uniref:Uncharacterized protein n=1 Tax=Arachis hypogaea TaxID=3818 RepID=A0A6B9VEK9_ARAHY|nr:uncharacterized protein DS421_19g671310 [Arachis hypogaea]